MSLFFKNRSLALDLGNNNTLLMDRERVLWSQPSYVVFDSGKKHVKAAGNEAYGMFEKSHAELKPVKPLKGGVIADFESASAMIRQVVSRTNQPNGWFSGIDKIISGVPYSSTEVERRALRDTLDLLNPRKRYLLYEPIAAALGMGINIEEPEGKMIIDMGGGITEVVVISLSGIVTSRSIKVAGDNFDRAIQDYFRKVHSMIIGNYTAEQIKRHAGAVVKKLEHSPPEFCVKGKDVKLGIPISKTVDHREIATILERPFEAIESCVISVLENCPPELAGDIYKNGVYVTGGGALLKGVKERFEKTLRLPVHVASEPLISVSRGVNMVLKNPDRYKAILV